MLVNNVKRYCFYFRRNITRILFLEAKIVNCVLTMIKKKKKNLNRNLSYLLSIIDCTLLWIF